MGMALRGYLCLVPGGPRGWWSGCTPGPRLKVPGVELAGRMARLCPPQTSDPKPTGVSGHPSWPHRAICDPGSGPSPHQATWPGQAMAAGVAQVGVSLGLPDMPTVPCGLSTPSRAHCVGSPGVGTCHSPSLPQLGPRSGLGENTSAPKMATAGIRKKWVCVGPHRGSLPPPRPGQTC